MRQTEEIIWNKTCNVPMLCIPAYVIDSPSVNSCKSNLEKHGELNMTCITLKKCFLAIALSEAPT